jgi:2-polyprenyl-3-methyl-5-hydroxy-6-metoxy-1,4-benzoquinol methylase
MRRWRCLGENESGSVSFAGTSDRYKAQPIKVDTMTDSARLYHSQYWTENAWCADWVKAQPSSYWRNMVDAICTHWITWLPPEERLAYLASEDGRRVGSDQLYLRMSQASSDFVPWLDTVAADRKRVLEIGGGAGSSTAALARAGYSVTTVDIAESFLAIGRIRADSLALRYDQILADENWLNTPESVERVFMQAKYPQIIVCYALFEHLTIAERLVLLTAIKQKMLNSPNLLLAIWETPNRLAPFDWHSSKTLLPDIVPDELSKLYLEATLPSSHPWRRHAPWNQPDGQTAWARTGRGMSFHELHAVFGPGGYEVIQDGYWQPDAQAHYKPVLEFETALQNIFSATSPPIHRAFCRPSLNLIIKIAAT